MLDKFFFRMMDNSTSMTEVGENACLDIVNLKTDHEEEEDKAKAAPK